MKLTLILAIVLVGFGTLIETDPIEYPIPPNSSEMLFYIQRNHNKNTIVYTANFDKEGNLIEDKPIDVYWIRYEEDGRRMELREIEKIFAYGVKSSKIETTNNQYKIKLVADEKRDLLLVQQAPFKAVVHTLINNKPSQLNHLYIFADNSGFWPKVKYIELFGKDISNGENFYEKIYNN
ncbi:MAG: DUF4833 domain-containing protein [Bacteroidales bacterium]|jgi:hypothetical protein|nr:DUF4833 domain-containing protein [Bacteroidales bacterium]